MNHWFDGLAMLHRFSFADGEVSYANRFLESRAYRAARDRGEIAYSEFATDPCRSLFARVSAMFSPKLTDNANVNLTKLGERFISMTETPIPVQFDPETLAAAGVAYEPPGQLTTAHPHMDRATKGMLNYAAKLGPRTSYRFFLLRPTGSKPEVIATKARARAGLHALVRAQRALARPGRVPVRGQPAASGVQRPPLHRELPLEARAGDAVSPLRPPRREIASVHSRPRPRFGFHHVNSYDDGDEVVVDISTFPDAGIVEDLYMEKLRAGKPVAPAHLERFRISPGAGTVTGERLIEEPIDLPRINYGRCNERPYRHAWGVGFGGGWIDRIVKADVVERRSTVWSEDDCFPGEPVFVADPEGEHEDEGVLLSIVLDGRKGNSFLLVLDASSLEELARAEVPHHIPFGFHGQFARA